MDTTSVNDYTVTGVAPDPYVSNVVGSVYDTNTLEQSRVAAIYRWPGIGTQGDMIQETIPQPGQYLGQRRNNAVRPMSMINNTVDPTFREGYRNTPSEHAAPLYGNMALNVGTVVLAIILAVSFLQNFDR